MTANAGHLLVAQGIKKTYQREAQTLTVLDGIDLNIEPGEAISIVGQSGAGKSTLLHILGSLDRPTLGRLYYKGEDLTARSDDQLAQFRNSKVGFVFQFHHLLGEFTALENAMMPMLIAGESSRQSRMRAEELLNTLGLASRKNHFPSQLSGGEQQRVAIARALVCRPELLLADEPTGNLDAANSQRIQTLFFDLKEQMGLTLIVVTHNEDFAHRFPKTLTLKDGHWVDEGQ